MPNWGLHILVADKIMGRVYVENPMDFIIGSIAPDDPLTDPRSDASKREKFHMHEYIGSYDVSLSPNITSWVQEHRSSNFMSDFYRGVIAHLVLDYEINFLWNTICKSGNILDSFGTKSPQMYQDVVPFKWKEARVYTSQAGDPEWLWHKYCNYSDISEDCMSMLESGFGITAKDMTNLYNAVSSQLKKDKRQLDHYDWFIPKRVYDATVKCVVEKCVYLYEILK